MQIKPIKFSPLVFPKIWGGNRIAALKKLDDAPKNIGESFEVSALPDEETFEREGDDPRQPLSAIVRKYGPRLLGDKIYAQYGTEFPLLVKIIDADEALSIQVHPDDVMAKRKGMPYGKTEMWYVLKADVGSKIYSGLRKSITPEEYEQLATAEPQNGRSPMQDVIATHEAHEGDLYFLPAGRLHAIGAGNFLAEIQQTSDITYRVYDFGRKDVHGNPRELHIEEAKAAIDYQVWPAYRTSYDSTKPTSQLINCPYFVVHRVVVQVAQQIDFHCDSFVIVVCLWGKANINGIEIRQGETILVPACENILYIFGNATFLTATM